MLLPISEIAPIDDNPLCAKGVHLEVRASRSQSPEGGLEWGVAVINLHLFRVF